MTELVSGEAGFSIAFTDGAFRGSGELFARAAARRWFEANKDALIAAVPEGCRVIRFTAIDPGDGETEIWNEVRLVNDTQAGVVEFRRLGHRMASLDEPAAMFMDEVRKQANAASDLKAAFEAVLLGGN